MENRMREAPGTMMMILPSNSTRDLLRTMMLAGNMVLSSKRRKNLCNRMTMMMQIDRMHPLLAEVSRSSGNWDHRKRLQAELESKNSSPKKWAAMLGLQHLYPPAQAVHSLRTTLSS